MESNVDEGVLVRQHRTVEERIEAARASVVQLGLDLRLFIDGMDDGVSDAFAAWPERIFVVAADGTLAYVGAPGPLGFDPDAARDAVLDVLDS
jgi:hypothetical protein